MKLYKKFLNFLIVICFIGPLCVSYWRGSWYLLDLFWFPDNVLLSAWTSACISFALIHLALFCHGYRETWIKNIKARTILYLIMFYPLSFLIVVYWRGIWLLWNHYTTVSFLSGVVSHFFGWFVVFPTKTSSTLVFPPGYCISERHNDLTECAIQIKLCFTGEKRFGFVPDCVFRLLNCFVMVWLIGTAVVSYWRGTWVVMDVVSMSEASDKYNSAIISLGVGVGITILCYCVSELITSRFNPNPPFSLLWRVFEHGFVYILAFGVVLFWRGVWYLEDLFFLPDHGVAGNLLGHAVGAAILYLIGGCLNLIVIPVTCRVHADNILEGLVLGSFLLTGQ